MGVHTDRLVRARLRMEELGVDALCCSVGADLPYLTGYEAMPLERLTMLVVGPGPGEAHLVVPQLEAPRAGDLESAELVAYEETDDPIALVARLLGPSRRVAIGDQTWARFVIDLQHAVPAADWCRASGVTGPLRAIKDPTEIELLRAAARAVDEIAREMATHPFAGRTERDVQRELEDRIVGHGHERVNFAIVASGPNGASPHHDPSDRVIERGDVVVCDFGGRMHGYCSDITRVFCADEPGSEVRDAYAVLREAQEAAVQASVVGAACEDVDAAARRVIEKGGYGGHFVHRTGHGIGLEEHEDPYLVAGNRAPLEVGHAFSIEPGIYLPGRFGLRLEDIVVATADGPDRLNDASRDLAIVD
ncbi:MAG: Xaa-Pro peptidase family protein [Acidimicrobiia bacterium]